MALTSFEKSRLQILKEYGVLDTQDDPDFNNLVKLAAQICDAPIAKLNFVDEDRVWSKANFGDDLKETPREYNFCHTTIEEDQYMVVEDASRDERFKDFEFVKNEPNIRFYAGVNIKKQNFNLGSICVLDNKPRELSDDQLSALKTLANEVEARLELIKKTRELENTNAFLKESVDLVMIIDAQTMIVEEFRNNQEELFGNLEELKSSKPLNEILPEWDLPEQLLQCLEDGKEVLKTESEVELSKGVFFLDVNATLKKGKWYLTAKNITKRKSAEEQIKKEQEFTEAIIESLPVNFFMYDEDWNVIKRHVTNAVEGIYSDDEFGNLSLKDLFDGEDLKKISDGVQKTLQTGEPVKGVEADLIRKDGTREPFLFNGVSFKKDGKKYLIGTSQSIVAQREYQEKLEQLLKDKEVLLAEVHHRVKNNMAVISGLLQIEGLLARNESAKSVLLSNQMRIKSMALVHEELYKAKSVSSISFDEYLVNLLDLIKREKGKPDKDIQLKTEVERFELNLNQAIPLALIINELVSNAFEYAFEGRERGEIDIHLKLKEDEVSLKIQDDGIGLPEGFVLEESPTLGTTIVSTYSEQINSEIDIKTEAGKGTTYTLTFQKTDNVRGSSSNITVQTT